MGRQHGGAVLPVERFGAAVAAVVEQGVLPVERVGDAAAVGCSCHTCDVIDSSPSTRERKQQSNNPSPSTRDKNSRATIPPPQGGAGKQRSNIFVISKQAVLS